MQGRGKKAAGGTASVVKMLKFAGAPDVVNLGKTGTQWLGRNFDQTKETVINHFGQRWTGAIRPRQKLPWFKGGGRVAPAYHTTLILLYYYGVLSQKILL